MCWSKGSFQGCHDEFPCCESLVQELLFTSAIQKHPHGRMAANLPDTFRIKETVLSWILDKRGEPTSSLPRRVILMTDYSGLGTVEYCAENLCRFLSIELRLHGSSDTNSNARKALLEHSSDHVFGDLTERVSQALRNKLKANLTRHQLTASVLMRQQPKKKHRATWIRDSHRIRENRAELYRDT